MNCSEIKEMINQIGIKALCNNLSNVCSRSCIESNYNCKCICDTNTDDDGYVNLYCDVNIDTYHRALYYLINFLLIFTFCLFCCAIFGICKRSYRKNINKFSSPTQYTYLPTYQQSVNQPQRNDIIPPPPQYNLESNVDSNVESNINPPPLYYLNVQTNTNTNTNTNTISNIKNI
jgi:hypothetical protein